MDAGVDLFHHAGMEDQPEDVEVGQQDLSKEPGHVSAESNPGGQEISTAQLGDQVAGEKGDNGAGNHAEGQVKEIEATGENDPEKEQDHKEHAPASAGRCFFLRREGFCIPGFRSFMPVGSLILVLHGSLGSKGLRRSTLTATHGAFQIPEANAVPGSTSEQEKDYEISAVFTFRGERSLSKSGPVKIPQNRVPYA
jgi:hypothetical protein